MILGVLLSLLLPVTAADAAEVTRYRVGGAATADGYAELGDAPAGGGTAAVVPHGGATGSWVFAPGATALVTGVPRQEAAGAGWRTGPLTGTVPAGTWRLAATVTTTLPAGTAEGQVLVAVRAATGASSRLLGVASTAGNVLATPGTTTSTLELALDEVVLRDERIVTEWYLAVARNASRDADAATSLAAGTAADTVVVPGDPTPLPLVGPTRAAVGAPQDHTLTVTWRPSGDARVTGYVVRRAAAATAAFTEVSGVLAPTADAYVLRNLTNGEPVFVDVVGVTDDGTRTPPSNVTQGRARDREPPDAPASLSATPTGTGRVQLSWPASAADDLAGYRLERAAGTGPFEVVADGLTARTYADVDLPPQTTWSYRVRAVDDDGLVAAPGPVATTTTAPAVPTGGRIAAVGDGAVTFAWDGTDRPLAGYRVERAVGSGSFSAVGGRVSGTSFTDTGLSNGTTYRYRVRAEDHGGVRSDPSSPVSAVPRRTDAPRPASWLTLADGTRSVTLGWGASPSPTVTGYRVLRSVAGGSPTELGGVQTGRTFTDRDVELGTRYEYMVVAVDGDGRRSPPTTAMAYALQPQAPRGLTAAPTGQTSVALSWSPSDDPGAGYEVWRARGSEAPALIARTEGTSFADVGLELGTRYRYFVRAVSAGFRASTASNVVEVTLQDGPPSAPIATAADTTEGGTVEVRWQPPTEADVVGWRIDRRVAGEARWEVVAEAPQPLRSHRDDQLTDGVRYEYRVVATDRAGTESPPSSIVTATPSDTTPPPSPAPPSVRPTVGALAVDWGVTPTATRYDVLRAGSADGPFQVVTTTSLRSFRDPDVVRGTSYHYRIVAYDAAGNASPTSDVGSGTFTTSASPGAVLPVLPVGGGSAGPVPPLGGVPPENPFDPTRPLFPDTGAGNGGAPGVDGVAPPGPSAQGDGVPGTGGDPVLALPPDLGDLRDAATAGDLPGVVGRVIGEVAGNVPEVARSFTIPLLLVVVILLYLVAQGRIDRDAAVLTVDRPTGGDDDDVEFLL